MVVGWRTRGFLAVLMSTAGAVWWERRGGVEGRYSDTFASSDTVRKGPRISQLSSWDSGHS